MEQSSFQMKAILDHLTISQLPSQERTQPRSALYCDLTLGLQVHTEPNPDHKKHALDL